MPSSRLVILLCFLATYLIMMAGVTVHAQGIGQNVAVTYPINEEGVRPGDIVARDRRSGVMRFARVPNSEDMFGVVVDNPVILFQTNATNSVPVVRSGQTLVNVTFANGPIEVGDLITSSYVPGYARKVVEGDTFQLGVALEPFNGAGSSTLVQAGPEADQNVSTGQILVDINIRPIVSSIHNGNSTTPSPAGMDQENILLITKYIVAGVIAVGSIYSSFRYFGSTLSSSVNSVGRNPMARKAIRRMLAINILAIVTISAAGIGLSIFILLFPV